MRIESHGIITLTLRAPIKGIHMNKPKAHKLLTGANILLAGAALTMLATTFAGAQPNLPRRTAGQYTCVGGQTIGGYTNVIYVLDSANRELVALKWDDGAKQLQGVGYRDLVTDITKENER